MNKLFTLSVLMLWTLAVQATPITRAQAMLLAQEYMVPGHQMVLAAEAKSRRAMAKDAPYYIISRGAGQGFVIVSGDDCMPTIWGYTESGDYDENDMPPAFREWVEGRAAQVEYAQEHGLNMVSSSTAEAMARRAPANRVDVPELLTTLWHQDTPYNDMCPKLANGDRAATGCVATAASQIIYYWRREARDAVSYDTPTYGYGDAPAKEEFQIKKGTPVMFDFMCESYNGSEPAIYKTQVATLVATVGMSAWLTYGSSTSGQIGNCPQVFSGQFGLNGGVCVYKKSGYSESAWSELLYQQLVQGRPVLYCGYNSSRGGHAVVCDGYRAKDGFFHINFGWGANYNGYFSVEDGVAGWGFNEADQGCVYDIYPRGMKAEASIRLPKVVYCNAVNEVEVTLTNCGTLPYSGVYLFASTSAVKPTVLSTAASKDTETVFKRDSEQKVRLTFNPNSERTFYLTVTDAQCNILAQTTVVPEAATCDLHLQRIWFDGSSEQEQKGDESFQVIYNSKPTAHVTIFNDSPSSCTNVSFQMNVWEYNADARSWSEVGEKNIKASFTAQTSTQLDFSMASTAACPMAVGKYYRVKLAPSNPQVTVDEGMDSVVQFVMRDASMEIVSYEESCLTMKGVFDLATFETRSFAGKGLYKTATAYDLTQCTGVGYVKPLEKANPNALFYVADDSPATGVNVIRHGQCADLQLTPGYDFQPRADFVASKVQMTIGSEPGRWYLLTVPFNTSVPDGIMAREVLSHHSLGIINLMNNQSTIDCHLLEAGKTYLVMGASAMSLTLTAENVTVKAAPVENADTAVVGTYRNITTPANALLIDETNGQTAVTVNEGSAVEALRGYFYATTLPSSFTANAEEIMDPYYNNLAKSISQAYQALEDYRDIVSEEAYATYLDAIHQAEHHFSYRGEGETDLTTTVLLNNDISTFEAAEDTYKHQIVDAGNMEVDFTSVIVNPSFEARRLTGWTLGTKDGYTIVGSACMGTEFNEDRTVGIDGSKYFRSRIAAANNSSVSISQTLTGLAPGYYRLSAWVGTDADSTVTLYAGDSTVTVSGHPFGSFYLTQAVVDQVKVVADEGAETGSLMIGVKEGAWYKVDDFRLTYVGSIAESDDTDPTAITSIPVDGGSISRHGIYTLQGIKVKEMTVPGIYVIDGKKVVK